MRYHRIPRFLLAAGSLAGIVGCTLLVFDVVAYFAVPTTLTGFTDVYRRSADFWSRTLNQPAIARGAPRHYHAADSVLGFDIVPGARTMAQVEGFRYDIWSNELGCFDRNTLADFTGRYAYFAGDSFTWGFADYPSKFATVWEIESGIPAAKCGVTHTGQRHQFEKFRRALARIGHAPEVVVVGFFYNDVANDAFFPHTTVIDGFLVDLYYGREGEAVGVPRDTLRAAVEQSLASGDGVRPQRRARDFLRVYSLSANIANYAVDLARAVVTQSAPAAGPRPTSRFGESLYTLYPEERVSEYSTDPFTEENRRAILDWKAHADSVGYRLVFVLIPPAVAFDDPAHYSSLERWLDDHGVAYRAAVEAFAGLDVADLYWPFDAHLTRTGNRVLGNWLVGAVEVVAR